MGVTLMDGALGTELAARGVPMPAPAWSAVALVEAPEVIAAIHAAYEAAGATVHTANTFRTKPRSLGADWERLLNAAVSIARGAIPAGQVVAGSLAPLEDCYRPDLSPADPRPEHRAVARALARAGVDLIVCETFPHIGEALVAVDEAVATGIPTWVAFTAGPDASLLSPSDIERGAREAVHRGARAVLVNCTAATLTLPYVERLRNVGCAFGAYANAGAPSDGVGWTNDLAAARAYATIARRWIDAGASLVGGCCGTGPAHIAALRAMLAELDGR